MLCPAKPAAPNITDNATGLEAQQPNGATATGGSNGHGKPSPPTEHNTATYAQASTVNLIASTRSIGFAITTSHRCAAHATRGTEPPATSNAPRSTDGEGEGAATHDEHPRKTPAPAKYAFKGRSGWVSHEAYRNPRGV